MMTPMQAGFRDIDEYYRTGPFEALVEERRTPIPASAKMLMLQPPAGSYPKPPTPDFNLVLTVGTPHRVNLDLGAGRTRNLSVSGDFGLQPPNAAADIVADDPHRLLIVSMPQWLVLRRLEELGQAITDFGVLHAHIFKDPLIEQLCLRMWTEAEAGSALGSIFIDTAVTAIVAVLARTAETTPATPVGRGGLPPFRLRRVIDYIHVRLQDDLRLEELAAVGGLSASHFARSFRRETGMSTHSYVLRARIERAKELLAGAEPSIREIAGLCGFSSAGHLARWFTKLVGVRPSDYRRSRR